MSKALMGGRLRRLREERGLSQVELSRALGLSPSYLNQLEHNQRPVTRRVRQLLTAKLGVEERALAEDAEARLLADLRDALTVLPAEEAIAPAELHALATELPSAARALLSVHRRYRDAVERSQAFAARIGDSARDGQMAAGATMPYEQVRDFFYSQNNYMAELEGAAEAIGHDASFGPRPTEQEIARRLHEKSGVRIEALPLEEGAERALRSYDPQSKLLRLHPYLSESQRRFQLATQLALLEGSDAIGQVVARSGLAGQETRKLARIGLASYFAGALLMPYQPFLEAAERLRYDLDQLGLLFGMGFESVCHRVSTLQRPSAHGVPFFFVRVDRAGNISKRQSATDFHFSRVGGTCPLWNVYEAFAQPGRILTQLAQMPEGRTYLWIARTVSHRLAGHSSGQPGKTFAIGLGCDVQHASRLVYSRGLDLRDPSAPTPIGAGCKVCERRGCTQRAFPFIGKRVAVDENLSRVAPYPVE